MLATPLHRSSLSLHSAEADVLLCPLEGLQAANPRLLVLLRNRITMPPLLPERLDRVDQAEAGHAEVRTVNEPEVPLGADRHVAHAQERLAAAHVALIGRRTNLHQPHLRAPVPGARSVAVTRDLLVPVILVEDQEAAGAVRHHLAGDAVEAGVANQRARGALDNVDTPAEGGGVTPDVVEPLVLIFEHRYRTTAEVPGHLEVLHAAVGDKPRHVISRQWRKLNGERANHKTHYRSKHGWSLLFRHAKADFAVAPVALTGSASKRVVCN